MGLLDSPDSDDDPTERQNLNLVLSLRNLVQIRCLELGLRLGKNLHRVLDKIAMKSLESVELRDPISRRGGGRRGGGRRSGWEFLESEGFAVPDTIKPRQETKVGEGRIKSGSLVVCDRERRR